MAGQFNNNFRAWKPVTVRAGKVVITFSTSMPDFLGGKE
jgi:hypothetical protein